MKDSASPLFIFFEVENQYRLTEIKLLENCNYCKTNDFYDNTGSHNNDETERCPGC